MSATVRLGDDQLDQLADLIADRLANRQAGDLITAGELAQRIGRSRDWIYDHSAALGAIRLGDGDRPRLMFRWPHVLDNLDTGKASRLSPSAVAPSKARRSRQAAAQLLPIRGRP